MWNIFWNIVLGCFGVLVIAITLYILIAIIDTIIKQFKRK